jgi:ribosomal protein S18 acetylase RimI-like enzyme
VPRGATAAVPIDPLRDIECRPARRDELHTALRLVLTSGGRAPDEGQLSEFIEYSAERGLDAGATWIAERRGRMLWAALPVVSPGRTMLLLAPGDLPGPGDSAAAGMLINTLCAHHGGRGVHLAQALLEPSAGAVVQLYEALGFRVMAELVYLQAQLRRVIVPPVLPPGFTWLNYSPAVHSLFAETILQTYRDSLDCPGLNGVRAIEDIIAGHKASGEFDPSLWFLLCEQHAGMSPTGSSTTGSAPVARGVLLLSRMPRSDAAELVYLGLPPDSRGRAFGDLLMRQALAATVATGRTRLTLAVDAGNDPAMRLYLRHGMQRLGSKTAMMREVGGLRLEG